MTDLLFTMAAYVVGQVALFGLALLAYVRWRVPARDLKVLLQECRLMPSKHDCWRLFDQVQGKRDNDESMTGTTRSPLRVITPSHEARGAMAVTRPRSRTGRLGSASSSVPDCLRLGGRE